MTHGQQTQYSIFVATPLYGPPTTATVSYEYHRALMCIAKDPAFHFANGVAFNDDLVRARSRAVRYFLNTQCTHLLFWDADVVPRSLMCLPAMLESDRDVIGLPYPRKAIDWTAIEAGVRDEEEMTRLGRQSAEEIEQLGMRYPMHQIDAPIVDHVGEVNAIGTGFLLIKRTCLEKMIAHYAAELTFEDSDRGEVVPTVMLFNLMREGNTLLHEDHSFCYRWRAMGGKVNMWMDPATHIGGHAFRGHVCGVAKAAT